MSLDDSLKKMRFDVRLADWNLANKKITAEELKRYLETLPDDSGNADIIQIEKLVKRPVGRTTGPKH